MRKTKAAFRALRDECGMTQQDIADEAGVNIRSVKRWESPSFPEIEPPDDIWAFVLAARGALHEDARSIADQIAESVRGIEGARDVTLDYYRTQSDLDAAQLGTGIDEPVGYTNARMRIVGHLLDRAEIPHTYRYAGQ